MNAQVLYAPKDLRFEQVSDRTPLEGEVLVKVRACGICGSDIPRIFDTGAHRHPLIPGHEFSGEVVAVGEKADPALVGRRVGVFPLIPCMECPCCKKKQYEMCAHYDYLGSRRDGGFAETVCVPVWNLVPLPDSVSYAQAAMLEPMAVAVHAMRRTGIGSGSGSGRSACVIGLGTIGLLLCMFLKAEGILDLYVAGNKDLQKQKALSLGIPEDHYIDARVCDTVAAVRERTGGAGTDFVFECVGRKESMAQSILAAVPGGEVVFVGNPASDMPLSRDVYWQILRKQLSVYGTWNSSYDPGSDTDDWSYVLRKLSDGDVHPESFITHTFPLEHLDQGLRIMHEKTESYIKIMVM